jgi:hypothetical protein
VFHRFWKGQFAYGGSILSSSQFLLLPQLPQNLMLDTKVDKNGSKIIISIQYYKSLKHTVAGNIV